MKAKYAPDDFLTNPNFHDGYLEGIMLEENDKVLLHCKTFDGMQVQIIIPNASLLNADNFRQGNIISDIRVYNSDQYRADLAERGEGFDKQIHKDIDMRMKKSPERGWSLFELMSSYGCDLLVLFDGKREDVKFIEA